MNNTDTGKLVYPVDQITETAQKLKDILSGYDINYTPLSEGDIKIVYDLFSGKLDNLGNMGQYSGDVLNCIGLYLRNVKNDITEARKYYLLAIKKGNVHAMNNYAWLLNHIGNTRISHKYYLMAINKGDTTAMNNYALTLEAGNRIQEAVRYYLMAIQAGNDDAMNNYGSILEHTGDTQNAKKYYLMAIQARNVSAMYNYAVILESEKNLQEAKKFYIMSMEKGDQRAFKHVQEIYIYEYCCSFKQQVPIDEEFYDFLKIAYDNPIFKKDLISIFLHLAEIYTTGLECIDLHIQYSPDGSGAKQAKKDFTDRIVNMKIHK